MFWKETICQASNKCQHKDCKHHKSHLPQSGFYNGEMVSELEYEVKNFAKKNKCPYGETWIVGKGLNTKKEWSNIMTELKKCPCGGKPFIYNPTDTGYPEDYIGAYYCVECDKCGRTSETFDTEEKAIKEWNKQVDAVQNKT